MARNVGSHFLTASGLFILIPMWRSPHKRAFVLEPTMDEYLDASSRERIRVLQVLVERLEKYGFDGGYLFTEHSLRALAEDTHDRRERDREVVEAWYRTQGVDPVMEGAKERLLSMLKR